MKKISPEPTSASAPPEGRVPASEQVNEQKASERAASERGASGTQPLLRAPQGRGHRSVVRLLEEWYVACLSSELGARPLARTVAGVPLVLFRDGGGHVHALLNRCPHRNVPLSLGRVATDGSLECGYHGWRFDGAGQCVAVPGSCRAATPRHRVDAHATREREGLVWVCPAEGTTPLRDPLQVPELADPRYEHVTRAVEVRASLQQTAENALDVPHTAYLHRGLFRGGKKNRIRAVVRRYSNRVEAEYLGEPKPPGLVAMILAPHGGGTVQHWDRFFLPGVAQVEYRLGADTHFLVTSYCTPVTDLQTRMFAVVCFRTPLPRRVVRAALEPVAMRIFRQDAEVLARQSEQIERFGGESFASTEIDVLGPTIWRLLREAERGETERRAEGGGSLAADEAPRGASATAPGGVAGAGASDEAPRAVHEVELEV